MRWFIYKLLSVFLFAARKIWLWAEGYFAYFYDDDDILPKSVTPYRGIVSFFLGWFYVIAIGLIFKFNESLGWVLFMVMLAPIIIHIIFGLLNLIVFDARDIFFDIYNRVRPKNTEIER